MPASPSTADSASKSRSGLLAIIWLIGFFAFFNSFDLPNSPRSRFDVWAMAPFQYMDLIDPVPVVGAPRSGWRNFPQRFDLIFVASVILAGAWGFGSLVLRVLLPPSQSRLERTVFAFGVGLSGLSLITLLFGLAGLLSRALFVGVILACVLGEVVCRFIQSKSEDGPRQLFAALNIFRPKQQSNSDEQFVISYEVLGKALRVAVIVAFLLAIYLGAMLPSTDFDVREYHLQGPKEFFQAGRIERLEHNVYTSFPFLTEMLSLLAMVLRDDWFRGALAGKAVLAMFAPLTSLAIFALARRWLSVEAAWLALLVHISTPWTYRISIIAYAEGGLTFYLFAAFFALLLALERLRRGESIFSHAMLLGLMSGSAMACKYPGVLTVIIPLCGALGFSLLRAKSATAGTSSPLTFANIAKPVGAVIVGIALTIGPWLVKNFAETGNPVYPLLYSVFGADDWDEDLNRRWKKAHSPDHHQPTDIVVKLIDVTAKSDWQSFLVFGFAPLTVIAWRSLWKDEASTGSLPPKFVLLAAWSYVGFLFFAWWTFTHRIDRFWVPLIPVAALLAGYSAAWLDSIGHLRIRRALMTVTIFYNLAFVTTDLCGFNAYLAESNHAQRIAEKLAFGIHSLNQLDISEDQTVLMVGEAQVFDARFKHKYNTVFDESIFERWCGFNDPNSKEGAVVMRPPDDIRKTLKQNNIAYIFVNWGEILRYRPTYGYTDFVNPAPFEYLKRHGIIKDAMNNMTTYRAWDNLSERDQKEVKRWAPDLFVERDGEKLMIGMQIFRVAD
ncbi:MAG: hypothetical protein CMJ78_08455 [Planctomycetaceae bacterium]|nr:hypothetical protein [Planctomycetaceae bacterium]